MCLFRARSNSFLPRLVLDLCILLLLGWNVLQVHALVTSTNLKDFGSFYYSVRLFLEGRDMYGPTLGTFSPAANLHYWNLNPPHFQLFLLPFGLLPPRVAVLLWLAAGLVMLALSVRIIMAELQIRPGPLQGRFFLIVLLGSAPLSTGLLTGQVALHLTLPVTLLWRSLRREKDFAAGVLLGLLASVKPFFLILVPWLLFKRRLAILLFTAVTAAVLVLAGSLVFGASSYGSWIRTIGQISWYGLDLNGSMLGFWSRLLGASREHLPLVRAPWLVTPLWAAGALLIGLLALDHCRRRAASGQAVDHQLALLLISAFLISPLGWIHYGVLLLGPLTSWFWNRESAQGLSPGVSSWLAILGLAGLFWPGQLNPLMQPGLARTIFFGSIYFWSLLLLWLALLLTCRGKRIHD